MVTGLLVGIFVGFCLSTGMQIYLHSKKPAPVAAEPDSKEPLYLIKDTEEYLRISVRVMRNECVYNYFYDIPAKEAHSIIENTAETMVTRKEGAIRIADGIFKIEEILGIDLDKIR